VGEPWQTIATVLVGVGSGVLSATFGVGGTAVSTPGIRLLGAGALTAVGTTLPSILPGAAAGTLRYSREGLVDWPLVAWTAPLGVVAAVAGSRLSRAVPGDGHVLMLATAALMLATAVRLALSHPATVPDPGRGADARRSPGPGPAVLVGLVAGGLSGLLGIGGGVVLIPAFAGWLRLPIKVAVATSLVCVGIFALPGTITHAALGEIDWSFAVPLSLAVIPGARLGSHLTVRATDRTLRRAVGLGLTVVALIYAAAELAALV
jgi:uncharacterized membrane protein YfcA